MPYHRWKSNETTGAVPYAYDRCLACQARRASDEGAQPCPANHEGELTMSSMKNAIYEAATALRIDVGALTEYMLEREPDDTAASDRRELVQHAARVLRITPTELLLAALDIVRSTDPTERRRATVAVRALSDIREAVSGVREDIAPGGRMADINAILSKAGY